MVSTCGTLNGCRLGRDTSMTVDDALMTPVELAAYLKIPEGTLAQWRYLGRGPRYVKSVGTSATDTPPWRRGYSKRVVIHVLRGHSHQSA